MKEKAQEAKSRGDEAFKKQEFMLAVDAYTQVDTAVRDLLLYCCSNSGTSRTILASSV